MKIYEFVGELEIVLTIKKQNYRIFVVLELWPYNFKNKSSKFQ